MEVAEDDPDEVVAILLPLSLPVLLKPNAEWFKLIFLKGLEGVGSAKKIREISGACFYCGGKKGLTLWLI